MPVVLHEQNVIPGVANRLLAHRATHVAISFPATREHIGRAGARTAVTGNPVRESLLNPVDRDEALAHFDLEPGRKTLALVGGSQGAAALNAVARDALPLLGRHEGLQFVHAVGPDRFDEHMSALPDTGSLLYRPLPFVERMDLLYAACDLAVCRAGATTVAELAVTGTPSILVPYPFATAAHQDANAAVMRDGGAARVASQSELDPELFYRMVSELIYDEDGLRAMSEAARGLGYPDATRRLADLVLAAGKE